MKIIKKDGRIEDYNYKKISKGIYYAAKEKQIDVSDCIEDIINSIEYEILVLSLSSEDVYNNHINTKDDITVKDYDGSITTDEIYDIITKVLFHYNHELCLSYIEYEKYRKKERIKNTDLIKTIKKFGVSTDRDNANVGSNFSAKLLRIASESNKTFNLTNMPEKYAKAHEEGDLYYHDLDSFNLTVNCLHIPTKEILEHGFNTGYGTIKPPKRIESAAELSCILLQATQNDMFGGQSHPNFDNDMAEYVELTRKEILNELYDNAKSLGLHINKDNTGLVKRAEEILNKRVHQAMQGIVYNLNTMHSRAGSQVPFSSINIGIPESKDAAIICESFLVEYEKGLGKGEQPIFPNIIFRVKKGVNKEKNDPYYYLYELACKVAAKRMNPTFMNIDADFNKEYYDKGYMPATMGCVDGKEVITYKIGDLLYVESFERMWKRISQLGIVKTQSDEVSQYIETNNENITIFDTKKGFVKVKTIIKNEDKGDWMSIKTSNNQKLIATSDHPLPVINRGRTFIKDINIGDKIIINPNYKKTKSPISGYKEVKITEIHFMGVRNEFSYDVETESDHFEVSGIYSHNCRTYLMKNVNGEPGCEGRGNIAPTTINLPRIGLEAKGDINLFFDIFSRRIELAKDSLLYRYDVLKHLKVKDLPFVVGQHIMRGSENLKDEDYIEPILKQGTWGIGFIGLAETLIALTGKHHGEDEYSRELGLKIITFLRNKTDYYSEKYKLNFSCYATPAEGLSGKFIKQDKRKFGIIKGVTDKDYYTNSFHVPVYYKTSIIHKIDVEAPYHKLCNGGHISYIEVDNTPSADIIMKILNYAYNNTNINYLGINFHIRYCKDCGESIINNESSCPKCGSKNIQGISRVTGYLSLDERFGEGKVAERKDRISLQNKKHEY